MTPAPPRWSAALLARVAPSTWGEHLAGDLSEEFVSRAVTSPFKARWWYRGQVARLIVMRAAWPNASNDRSHGARWTRLGCDIAAAWRALIRQPRFAALFVVVLGGSLGSASAVFAFVDSYLWRDLPYPAVDRLVWIEGGQRGIPGPRNMDALDHDAMGDIADLAVSWDLDGFTIVGDGAPQFVLGSWTTADVFPFFGIQPVLGRVFTKEEVATSSPVAVISHRLWQSRYGGEASAVGRTINVRGSDRPDETRTFTIVGVLPPRFWHLDDRTDLMVPLRGPFETYMIRVREGLSLESARQTLLARIAAANPTLDPRWPLKFTSLRDRHVAPVRALLEAVAIAVGLLLLIACANLALAQTARALTRDRECAVKTALGASRRQLIRQFMYESVFMATASFGVAALLASLMTAASRPLVETFTGRLVPGRQWDPLVTPSMLMMMAAASFGAALLFGLLPAAQRLSGKTRSLAGLLIGTPGTNGPAHTRARHIIIGIQVAATMTLLVSAGLMLQTAWRLGHTSSGLDATGVLQAAIEIPKPTGPSSPTVPQQIERTIAAIEAQPGVESASFMTGWAFGMSVGRQVAADEHEAQAMVMAITPAYLRTLRIPLVQGREFTSGDRDGSPQVAIVGAALAQTLWPSSSPLDRILTVSSPRQGEPRATPGGSYRVVGVAGEVTRSLRERSLPEVYLSLAQAPQGTLTLHVRSRESQPVSATEVAQAIATVDPNLPLYNPRPFSLVVGSEGVRPRFLATVLTGFSAIAALVALTGIYAVSDWIARHRRREAAIRLALGARPRDVMRVLTMSGAITVVAGLVAGWFGSLTLSRLLSSDLSGVGAGDSATRAVVAGVLFVTCLVAIIRPAQSVSSADPAAVLRE